MQQLTVKYARDAYLPSLQQLVDFGEPVDVRGRKTTEILNYVTEITEPWHHCILIPSRRWNPWLAMSEALWILAGRNDVAALKPYNSRISDFSDDGNTLYGAYGARLYEQIDPLIERLRKDPSDRRAVLSIWDNSGMALVNAGVDERHILLHNDLTVNSKDPPCNDMVFFKLRDNKLHMTVMCRSNDIHWGLYAVNLPTFGILQEYIAARLGVDMGTQTHLSNSFHVYTDDKAAVEITDRMLYRETEDKPAYPEHEVLFHNFPDIKGLPFVHGMIAEECSAILDCEDIGPQIHFFEFASDFLKQYREHEWHPKDIRWHGIHQDWIMSGQIFVDKVWRHESSRV